MQTQKFGNENKDMEDMLSEGELWEDITDDREEWTGNPARKVILQVQQGGGEECGVIDLVNIAGYMKQKWKFYLYLLMIAVCVSLIAAVASLGLQAVFGGKSRAEAVINFSFDGIDEGRDPSGGLFDVTKIKSTVVINDALEELGWSDQNVEEIRA